MAETPPDVESSLDRIVGRLTRPGAPKEAKAMLVDARRLRTVVGNWRTIPPTDEARKEMAARVEQLVRSVDSVVPDEPAPEPAAPQALGVLEARVERRSMPITEEIRPGAIAEPIGRRSTGRDVRASQPSAEPEPRTRATPPPPDLAAPEPRMRATPPPPPTPSETSWDDPPSLVVPARSLFPVVDEPTRVAPIATQARADQERAAARDVRQANARAASGTGVAGSMEASEIAVAAMIQGPPSLVMAVSPEVAAAAKQARTNGIEPVRARTLPDLDISGIAQLIDDGGDPFDDPFESRPTVARNVRPDLDAMRRRPASEPPPARRGAPATEERSGRLTGRHSRFLDDPESDPGGDGAGPVYTGAGEEPAVAQRMTPRPSSPPAPNHPEKTSIAVKPLPPPDPLDKRLIMLTEPYSTRADAYRALRRKLSGPGAPRTIAVTSAQPEEGKTSCAVNLALAFRETSNEKVLLIEANLRAPTLAKLFGFEPPVCFAKQMAKNRDLGRASWTVVEQFEPLHVLAVDPSSKTSPLLDPVAFANALEQLVEAGYDHIIVDTPPALGGSDVNLIADAVDGMVVVAWIKKSKKSLVKKAIDQLRPATILGVVTLEG